LSGLLAGGVGGDEGGDLVVQLVGPVEAAVAAGNDGDFRVRHEAPLGAAISLMTMSAGLGTSVLAGHSTPEQAQAVIDYHLRLLFPTYAS
jgi:hypothetical protein